MFSRTLMAASFVFVVSGCTVTAGAQRVATALVADTNRDGVVSLPGDLDGRATWSVGSGAIFLNNCDDDDQDGEPDNADEVVNGDADLSDLARVLVRPPRGMSDATKLVLEVDPVAADRVRLFEKKEDGSFSVVTTGVEFTTGGNPESLAEFAIEAKQFADEQWDGLATLTLKVKREGVVELTDSVQLKVAPWIMLANDKAGEVVYVREFPGRNDEFLASLKRFVPEAAAELHIIPGDAPYEPYEIWLQDTMEIGYTEMPGVRMPVVLQANRGKTIDEFSRNTLLGPDFGWYRTGDFRPKFGAGEGGVSWIDWFGNLEIAPPTETWPQGRMYYGYAAEDGEAQLDSRIVSMIAAQGVQAPPLPMDVSWLLIKHVDEMVCFVPTGTDSDPYKVLVPSVEAMIDLAESWIDAGHGEAAFLDVFEEKMTVASFLGDTALREYNEELQREHLDTSNALIVSELGVDEDDLIHVPAYYKADGRSMVPNMVNSLLVNDTLFLPDPNGPVVEGEDQLEAHMIRLLSGLPQKKVFVDDRQYHKWCGNVHCATNTLRDPGEIKWWEVNQE